MQFFSRDKEVIQTSKIKAEQTSSQHLDNTLQFLLEHQRQCTFCPQLFSIYQTNLMINRALYLKYASSQNYYYSKKINEWVEKTNADQQRTIYFQDIVIFEEEIEYCTERFSKEQIKSKLIFLSGYFQYHQEIPRFFTKSLWHILVNCYDQHRKIEYYSVKKMLRQEKLANRQAGIEQVSDSQSDSYNTESNSNFNFYQKKEQQQQQLFFQQDIIKSKILDLLTEDAQTSYQLNKVLRDEKSQFEWNVNELKKKQNEFFQEKWEKNELELSLPKQGEQEKTIQELQQLLNAPKEDQDQKEKRLESTAFLKNKIYFNNDSTKSKKLSNQVKLKMQIFVKEDINQLNDYLCKQQQNMIIEKQKNKKEKNQKGEVYKQPNTQMNKQSENEDKPIPFNSARLQRHNSGNTNQLQITNNLKNEILIQKNHR